jgi:regulator of PEP synthase PpsR (kinase-PPPase family)
MQILNLHLVSDYSGKTVHSIAKAIRHRFHNIEIKEYFWPLVNNKEILIDTLEKIKKFPGVVLYTITNKDLRSILKKECKIYNIPCISAIGKIVREIGSYVGDENVKGESFDEKFDDEYFEKIAAIEYTLKHDDGQNIETIDVADIIILGASRTSKTPTSFYLANNGYKVANIPYISSVGFPEKLAILKRPLIVGLSVDYERLVHVRENRMNYMNLQKDINYTDFITVKEECKEIQSIFKKLNILVIDVTRLSIEETSALIIKERLKKNNIMIF